MPGVYLARNPWSRAERRRMRVITRLPFARQYDSVPLLERNRREPAHQAATGHKLGQMPELPDVCVYREALEQRIVGQRLEKILLRSPFLLRTAEPPIESALRPARRPKCAASASASRSGSKEISGWCFT